MALSVGPIINDCLVSGGRVLGGIACAWRALKAHSGSHIEALQAQVQDLESAVVAREWYIKEEITITLAWERELWQRERESQAIAMEREKS